MVGPGGVCAAGRTGRPCAPSPAARSRRKPSGARAGLLLAPGPAARAPIPSVGPFCVSVVTRSPHGRPCSRPFVSRAPSFLSSPARVCDRFRRGAIPLLLSLGRRLRCGHVCNKSFDFRTHGSCFESRCTGRTSVVEGLQCLRGPVVLGLCDENISEDRWPGPKGRLGSARVGWNKKGGSSPREEIRVVIKESHPKFTWCLLVL